MQYKCCNITQYILNLHLDRLTEIRKKHRWYVDYGEVDVATKKKETKEENFVANILRAASVSYIPFQGQENIFIYVCYTLLDDAYDIQSMQQIMEIVL